MPILYYVRHGETDFNVEARLQGRRDTGSTRAAGSRPRNAAICCAICSRATGAGRRFRLCGEPAEAGARNHGNFARHARARSACLRVDDRLMEIAYGEWEGLTLPEIDARDAGPAGGARARQMGFCAARRRKLSRSHGPHQRMVCGADAGHRGCRAWRRRARAYGAVRTCCRRRKRRMPRSRRAWSMYFSTARWRATRKQRERRHAAPSSGRRPISWPYWLP